MMNKPDFSPPAAIKYDGSQQVLSLSDAHQFWANKCRQDIFSFAKFVYGIEPAAHHRRWIQEILNPDNNRLMIIAPRESAKTTWIASVLLAWYIGHNPSSRNAIFSVTEDQAINRLVGLRDLIKNNPRYKLVFPWVEPDKQKAWTSTVFNVWDGRFQTRTAYAAWEAQHSDAPKDHTMRAGGAASSTIIGNRYNGIILLDDIHDEKNTNTRETIDKIETWFLGTVANCARPSAKIVIIGTRWAQEDLLGRLMEKKDTEGKKIWKVMETPALTTDKKGRYVSYWPENWPVKRLLEKKAEVGDVIFELMYNNDANAMSGDVFKPEYLENQIPHIKFMPKFRRVYIGVDPAFTQKSRSDNTCIALLGITDDNRVYNIKMWVGRFDKNRMRNALLQAYTMGVENFGRVDRIYIESGGAQTMLVADLIEETKLPIMGIPAAGSGDKVAKAQQFSIVAAKGHYYCDWTSREGRLHKGELLSFPTAPHDDTVDAVGMVIRATMGTGLITKPTLRLVRLNGTKAALDKVQ